MDEMRAFIGFGLIVFAFCVFMALYHLHKKIKRRQEQIIKEIESEARKKTDDAISTLTIDTSFADIGLGKPPEVHDLLAQLDMEQQALKKAKIDKIIEEEARHKEKLTAEAQSRAFDEIMRESRINLYQKANEKQKEVPASEKKKAYAKAAQNKNEREQEERSKQEQQRNEEKERETENQKKEQEKDDRQKEQEHQKEIEKIQELRGVKETEESAKQSSGAEHSNSNTNTGAQNSGGFSGGMSGGHSGGR